MPRLRRAGLSGYAIGIVYPYSTARQCAHARQVAAERASAARNVLSEYENGAWRNAVPDWVEERMDGAVEVIATRGDGQTVAIEHTIVQPFVGEKSDSNAFMQAFGRIEKNPDLVVAGRSMTVVIPVGAIPKGYKWEE